MTNEALNTAQAREAKLIAKEEVREYFDYYLRVIVPQQRDSERELVEMKIAAHDEDDDAHGGVEIRVSRLMWVIAGAALAGGGAAGGIAQLLQAIV
jgi:hypothetical protein